MKNILGALLIMLSTSAYTADFSGSVAYTNDYLFRGMSQGPDNAIQLEFEAEHYFGNYGVYAGAWASEVEFNNHVREIDVYGGIIIPIYENLILDLGYIDYNYDYNGDDDFSEIYAGIQYMFKSGANLEAYVWQTDVESYENKDETASVVYMHPLELPVIGKIMAGASYIYFQQDETMVMLMVNKKLEKGFSFGIEVGEDMMTKEKLVSAKLQLDF